MARALTEHEREIRNARGKEHVARLREAEALLSQLRARLDLEAGVPPHAWAPAIDRGLVAARADPDPLAIVWWVSRLGQWVGAHLASVYAGHWYLDENPDGQTFLRSVVGGFGLRTDEVEVASDGPRYDPFRIAATAFAEHLCLVDTLDAIAHELATAGIVPVAQGRSAEA